jgi:hypothetical protein
MMLLTCLMLRLRNRARIITSGTMTNNDNIFIALNEK